LEPCYWIGFFFGSLASLGATACCERILSVSAPRILALALWDFGIFFASFNDLLAVHPRLLARGPKTFFTLGSGAATLDLSTQAFILQVGPHIISIASAASMRAAIVVDMQNDFG
jgi:hypothetical protein